MRVVNTRRSTSRLSTASEGAGRRCHSVRQHLPSSHLRRPGQERMDPAPGARHQPGRLLSLQFQLLVSLRRLRGVMCTQIRCLISGLQSQS